MATTAIVDGAALSRVLTDVGPGVFLDELIVRLRRTIAELEPEKVSTRDRDGFHYTKPDLGLIEWMPAIDTGRRVAIKTVGYHPSNPFQRSLPSVLGTISVYDCASGALEGIVEGTTLTAIRTGAASALVSDLLAADRPLVVSMIGCGAQAVTQLHALSRVREVARVLAYDVVADVAESFSARVDGIVHAPVEVIAAAAHHRLLAEADVVCTSTSVGIGEGPVFSMGPCKHDLHVNAVGADFAGKLELPSPLLASAFVVPDVRSQCILEGECQQLANHQIGPDLVELVQRPDRFAHRRHGLSVFDSTGWALEDLVAAELVLEHAQRTGTATMVDLQSGGTDPFDPYEGVA